MKARIRRGIVTSLAAFAVACALAPGAGAIELAEGFQHHSELTGLSRPTKIAWAPDGRRFVAEKDGVVRVAPPTGTSSQVLLDIRDKANNAGDRGLLGLAVDSDFAGSHPYLYLLYTYDVKKDTDPDSEGGMASQLLRLKISASNQILEQKVLLGSVVDGVCPAPSNTVDCIPSDGTSHSIGTVISDPDGSLWVGNGDAAGFTELDPLSLRTYNEGSMAGKIMHLDREGKGLSGHPFCPSESDLTRVCTKLWAKGFRNPFRFTRRPNGFLLVGDVGWNSDEEMDAVWRGGRNYGWPCYEGVIHTPTWKDRDDCEPLYQRESTEAGADWPIYAYGHTGSNAIMAGPEYTGGPYPDAFDGTLFFGDFGSGFIKRMSFTHDGWSDQVFNFATDWHGVDLTPAPNGDLTYAEPDDWGDGSGTIERITYSPGNRPPVALADADPKAGEPPLAVHFHSTGSNDPDGDALTYDWDFGDGSAHGTGVSPTHTYTARGSYTATLTVSDGEATDTDTVQIDVANTPPVPSITPPPGSRYRDGVELTITGSATDDAPGTTLHWDVVLKHRDDGPGAHTHPMTNGNGGSITFTPLTDHNADSHYEITLTATDADGAAVSTELRIDPETIPLHLRSAPAGAALSYAGTPVVAPVTEETAIGFMTSVSAAESFKIGGVTWEFDHWSDGGDRAHVFPAPAAETTLTAVYQTPAGPLLGPVPGQPLAPTRKDTHGPRIGFNPDRALVLRRHLLHGVADDGSGVKAVSIALGRLQRHRCRWLVAKPRRLARQASSCAHPRWIAAKLDGRRWSVRLPKTISPGLYRVRFRAIDTHGNRSRHLRDGSAGAQLRMPAPTD